MAVEEPPAWLLALATRTQARLESLWRLAVVTRRARPAGGRETVVTGRFGAPAVIVLCVLFLALVWVLFLAILDQL